MYQAKLQLRPKDQKLYSYVITQIKDNDIKIIKESKLKEGIDLYIDSNKFAFSLAKKFKHKFKGETRITKSLYGLNKQAGKQINRLTVLLRMPKEEPDE
ncbi:MAG: NMD3-related protein [Candidatus Woesearchaeota archaeon]